MTRALNTSSKSFGPGQPARTAQADLGRNLSLLVNFRLVKGRVYLKKKKCYGSIMTQKITR